ETLLRAPSRGRRGRRRRVPAPPDARRRRRRRRGLRDVVAHGERERRSAAVRPAGDRDRREHLHVRRLPDRVPRLRRGPPHRVLEGRLVGLRSGARRRVRRVRQAVAGAPPGRGPQRGRGGDRGGTEGRDGAQGRGRDGSGSLL
ncbi:MAG: hypothetical protein AVDCRST_MAG85-3856, partial [uncultured Solirubrobacteraceae bacterium]